MFRPSVEQLIDVLNAKQYQIYDTPTIDWNLNIIGIRALDAEPKKFDDTLVVFHKFRGLWEIYYYHITTDPSLYYLMNPISASGTAILKEGQYKGTYQLDIHKRGKKGAHLALCQRLAPVTVYRDNDRDDKLNLIASKTQKGMFGINVHRGPLSSDLNVDNWKFSAGCQVFADQRQFADFLLKCKAGEKVFGNKFTYTLLHQKDF
jgi:hypothetical protein